MDFSFVVEMLERVIRLIGVPELPSIEVVITELLEELGKVP